MPTTSTGVDATTLSAPDLGGASFVQQGVVDESFQFEAASKVSVLNAASQAVEVGGQLALDADAGFANAQLEGNINGFLEQANSETVLENKRAIFSDAKEELTKINAKLEAGGDDIGNQAPEVKRVTDNVLAGLAQGVLTPREVEIRTKDAIRDAIARRPGLARELTEHAERVLNLSGIRDRDSLETDLDKLEQKRSEKAYNDVISIAIQNGIPFDRLKPNIQELNKMNQQIAEEAHIFENMKSIKMLSDEEKEMRKTDFITALPMARQGVLNQFAFEARALFPAGQSDAERSSAMGKLTALETSFFNFADSAITDARIENSVSAPHRASLTQQLKSQREAIEAHAKGGNIAEFAQLNALYMRSTQEAHLRGKFPVATLDLLGRTSQGILGLMLEKNPTYQANMTGVLANLAGNVGSSTGSLMDAINSEELQPGVSDMASGVRAILESSTPMPDDSEEIRKGKFPLHFENAIESVSTILIDNPQGIDSPTRFKLLSNLVTQLSEPGSIAFLNNTSDIAKQKLGNLYDQHAIVLSTRTDVAVKKAESLGATVSKRFSPDGRLEFVVSHPTPQIQREQSNRLNNGVARFTNELIKGFGALFGEGNDRTMEIIRGKFDGTGTPAEGDPTLEFIKEEEGFREEAYLDSAGVPTIGFGFTTIDGKDVEIGDVITREEADKEVPKQVQAHSNYNREVTVALSPSQKKALSSFEFNLGAGIWKTTGAPIIAAINEGNLEEAAAIMKRHNKARDPRSNQLKEIRGLTNRRGREADLLLAAN